MRALGAWWRRLTDTAADTSSARVSGPPPSANGASSLHLGWHLHGEFDEVSVTLEVIEPPRVDSLYFWALQTDFAAAGGTRAGGAHLGLQWHPGYPASRAVNWGGYDPGGSELHGSASALPSSLGNANTRDLTWSPRARHRLTVAPAPQADQPPEGVATAWRGTVTDLDRGTVSVVRDLYARGDRIVGVTMWSEVFADCGAPPAAVRWSDPVAHSPGGGSVVPTALGVNYQRHDDGGCANTDSSCDGVGVVQRTAVTRRTPQGAVLPIR